MDGILPLYKPKGMTSHDCDAKLRKLFRTRKIGHGGTLDPNVDGVLPICVGRATKVVDYLVASGKTYHGEVLLGQATTTEDLDGEIVAEKPVLAPIETAEIDQAMTQFVGEITQIPPLFSAVKVKGRRLYDYARAGDPVERPKRQVTIFKFQRTTTPVYDAATRTQRFEFDVKCSKGTYVRTLAVNLGEALGYPAVMSALTRVSSGGFALADTVTLEQVAAAVAAEQAPQLLKPLDFALRHLPAIDLLPEQWERVQNGGFLDANEVTVSIDEPLITLRYQQQVKAIYRPGKTAAYWQPQKMISTES
jgi:tRNA pseudouridine55 synthase